MLTLFGLMKFWAGFSGVEAPVTVSSVIKTIGGFSSPMAMGQLVTSSMNGLIKAPKTTGKFR